MATEENGRLRRLEAGPPDGRLIMTCIINLSVYPRDWPIRGSPVRRDGQCMLLTDRAPPRPAEGR